MPMSGAMALRFVFVCLAALQAAASSAEVCKGLLFDGKHYTEKPMKADVYKPASLAVDYKSNDLYFSYIHQTGEVYYKTARINLKTKEFAELEVNNGFSVTVDQKHHNAYIGGYKGVYKMNSRSNKAHLIIPGVNVWDVFFKDVLYYIEFLSQTLYSYADGKSTPVEELAGTKVYYFVIDDEDYMVYSNGTGLFGKQRGVEGTALYKEFESVDVIRDIVLDRNGKVFVVSADGIYRVNKVTESLEKVAEIQDAFGMAFDAENQLIYSKENALVRLIPNKSCK